MHFLNSTEGVPIGGPHSCCVISKHVVLQLGILLCSRHRMHAIPLLSASHTKTDHSTPRILKFTSSTPSKPCNTVTSWWAMGLKHWCPRTWAAQSAELHRMLGVGAFLLFNPVRALEKAFKEGSWCRMKCEHGQLIHKRQKSLDPLSVKH